MRLALQRRAGLVSLLALILVATAAPAQERVRFPTVDGVEIMGKFYPSATKKNPPVVMLLHAFENNSNSKDWVQLATALQKAGYAVLAFDFRGHGDSTAVDPALFWKYTPNQAGIKNFKPTRDSIEFKDFRPEYRTALINDIAAAKAFLDRKNDTGACNTGSTIVIGAEEGAALGAIWVNSEWHRFKMVPNMFGAMTLATSPEGRDICACLWLSISPKLGNTSLSLSKTLYLAGREQATPMVFFHGDGDKEGKAIASSLEKYLKDPKAKEKHRFTGAHEIKGSKLTGPALVKSAGTVDAITEWLDQVVLAKGTEWIERDFRKTQYYWRTPGTAGKMLPARIDAREMNMMYDTYYKFLVR